MLQSNETSERLTIFPPCAGQGSSSRLPGNRVKAFCAALVIEARARIGARAPLSTRYELWLAWLIGLSLVVPPICFWLTAYPFFVGYAVADGASSGPRFTITVVNGLITGFGSLGVAYTSWLALD